MNNKNLQKPQKKKNQERTKEQKETKQRNYIKKRPKHCVVKLDYQMIGNNRKAANQTKVIYRSI